MVRRKNTLLIALKWSLIMPPCITTTTLGSTSLTSLRRPDRIPTSCRTHSPTTSANVVQRTVPRSSEPSVGPVVVVGISASTTSSHAPYGFSGAGALWSEAYERSNLQSSWWYHRVYLRHLD